MGSRKDLTVPMDEEMNKEIEAQLEYGDSKAEWIRDAIRRKLDTEQGGGKTKQGAST